MPDLASMMSVQSETARRLTTRRSNPMVQQMMRDPQMIQQCARLIELSY